MQTDDIFRYMQSAVEAAQTSQHPTSKVGACLVGDGFHVARPNFWPKAIWDKIGGDHKIGNASGTVHAETACLLNAPAATMGSAVFSTDPSCPNCTKNMAEAGVRHLYIDHKGFEKYYAKTRMQDFEDLSLNACRAAGMGVSHVYRKEKRIEEILPTTDKPDFLDFVVPVTGDNPADIWRDYQQRRDKPQRPYSAALCQSAHGRIVLLQTPRRDGGEAPAGSKYNFNIEPLTRLMMIAAREGLAIIPGYTLSSRVPTARELVNFIGGGHTQLTIENLEDSRDTHGFSALNQLKIAHILNIA